MIAARHRQPDTFRLIVPSFTLRWFPKGEHCYDSTSGDELIVRHHTVMADAISIGQEAMALTRPELRGYTWPDHDAFIHLGGPGAIVSEMGPRGYERRGLKDYQDELYAVVHYDVSDELRANAVAFDNACSEIDYGWDEYVDDILDGLTHAKFAGSWGDNIICSTHLTLVTMALGFMPALNPDQVVPAHRAMWLGARQP
jgi:hypothetical protein